MKKKKRPYSYSRVRADINEVPKVMKQLEDEKISLGQRIAEKFAQFVGSWQFILVQSGLFVLWVIFNVLAWIQHWDPYPFILLNLVLSFQAAYFGPIIMMAQNHKENRDRLRSELDFQVNLVAEREIKKVLNKFHSVRLAHMTRIEHKIDKILRAK